VDPERSDDRDGADLRLDENQYNGMKLVMDRDYDQSWIMEAIRRVEADANRSADTHLHVFPLPESWEIDLYLKDESVHPTGSLKHRLARSLFLYALANNWITESTTVVEASSGSTAISEAYFARLLGLPFVAVMPASTSPEKITLIEAYGGTCHLVSDPRSIYDVAKVLAADAGGHYMDQFLYAERATDWRGNNNIAESIYEQMRVERYPVPSWIVVGAGTGGTSTTIGRYIRYRRYSTRLCVVDPEGSAFFESWALGKQDYRSAGSRIEGIGRPQVEPSFVPTVVDRMARVLDAASLGAMHVVREVTGRRVGGSTGTNVWGALQLIAQMKQEGIKGSVVTLICDGGERYERTYYSDEWLRRNSLDTGSSAASIHHFLATGQWSGH
jgi:cysteine synthase